MQITRTKQKDLFYTTTQQTLDRTKVSINSTWKEGLHKRQVWQGEVDQQKEKEPTPTDF